MAKDTVSLIPEWITNQARTKSSQAITPTWVKEWAAANPPTTALATRPGGMTFANLTAAQKSQYAKMLRPYMSRLVSGSMSPKEVMALGQQIQKRFQLQLPGPGGPGTMLGGSGDAALARRGGALATIRRSSGGAQLNKIPPPYKVNVASAAKTAASEGAAFGPLPSGAAKAAGGAAGGAVGKAKGLLSKIWSGGGNAMLAGAVQMATGLMIGYIVCEGLDMFDVGGQNAREGEAMGKLAWSQAGILPGQSTEEAGNAMFERALLPQLQSEYGAATSQLYGMMGGGATPVPMPMMNRASDDISIGGGGGAPGGQEAELMALLQAMGG